MNYVMQTGRDAMTDTLEELHHIAQDLESLVAESCRKEIRQPLERLDQAVRDIRKASSGSWFGYQASVYTSDLQPPDYRARFDPDVGLNPYGMQLYGSWRKYGYQEIKKAVFQLAGNPDMKLALAFNDKASNKFRDHKFTLLSILDVEIRNSPSPLLSDLKEEVDELSLKTDSEFVDSWRPKSRTTSDKRAVGQTIQTPPHLSIDAKAKATEHTMRAVTGLEELTRQIISHLSRQRSHQQSSVASGTTVFIGHGRSHIWRELKDFLKDQLGLPVEEFNRVPVAGVSITDRLSEMLDSAAIAFLVMTGEDEQPSGELRARENVVHEAGLFQGRLSFKRAIVLLEDGCDKFSNNAGLVHIGFPKDNIKAAFQDIRGVLEREGVLSE